MAEIFEALSSALKFVFSKLKWAPFSLALGKNQDCLSGSRRILQELFYSSLQGSFNFYAVMCCRIQTLTSSSRTKVLFWESNLVFCEKPLKEKNVKETFLCSKQFRVFVACHTDALLFHKEAPDRNSSDQRILILRDKRLLDVPSFL